MKHGKPRRAHCEPGSMTNTRELGERLRLSRERLAASELAVQGMAWRLWAACVDATFGYAREADTIYLSTLSRTSGVHRSKAGPLLRRFDDLGVFVWEAADRGSHRISELRLPRLTHVPTTGHEGVTQVSHVPLTGHEEGVSCTAHGSLQSNIHRNNGHSSVGDLLEEEGVVSLDGEAETGEPQVGSPEAWPVLCPIHSEELFEGRCCISCDLDASHRLWRQLQSREVSEP